jgi:hypothetical protein
MHIFLRKQQEKLELKLKQLEEEEAEIERRQKEEIDQNKTKNSHQTREQNKTLNDSNSNSSSLTISHSISDNQNNKNNQATLTRILSNEEKKRIEYQQALLNNQNLKQISSSSSENLYQQIEERKKEIMKTFGIQGNSSSSTSSISNNSNEDDLAVVARQNNPQLIKNFTDKHPVSSSGDSGFVSSSTLNQFNMNLRNQTQQLKKPLNFEVEELNHQIKMNASRLGSGQNNNNNNNNNELLNLLNNQEDFKRRLSSTSSSSSSSTSSSAYFSHNNSKSDAQLSNQQQLLGLEFFDSMQNMSEIRDASIEKLIGMTLNLSSGMMNNQGTHSPNLEFLRSKIIELAASKSLSKKFNLSIETLNSSNEENHLSKEEDEVGDTDVDEESQALIMSLLNSRNNKNKPELNNKLFDLKDQLEMIRKQKEQLVEQHQQQLQNKIAAFSHSIVPAVNNNTNSVPPPVKTNKFIDVNLHELSTIKEVDTPKSERNARPSSLSNNNNNFVPRKLNVIF